jgi:hypothetical protein
MTTVTEATSSSLISTEPTGFPPGSVLDQLYQTMNNEKETGNRYMRLTVNEPTKDVRKNLDRLENEQSEALAKEIKASESLSAWSFASYIASVAYATSSILGGAYLQFIGHPAGKQFIGAGALLLANTVLSEKDRWGTISRFLSLGNSTVEQALHTVLPLATSLSSYAWNASTLAGLNAVHKEKIQLIDRLFSFVNTAIEIGRIYTKFKQGQAERVTQDIDAQMSVETTKINQLQLRREGVTDTNKRIESGIRRAIRNQININTDIVKNH